MSGIRGAALPLLGRAVVTASAIALLAGLFTETIIPPVAIGAGALLVVFTMLAAWE